LLIGVSGRIRFAGFARLVGLARLNSPKLAKEQGLTRTISRERRHLSAGVMKGGNASGAVSGG